MIKYIPLTFVNSSVEKERLIRNTVLLRHFASEADGNVTLSHYIESTQYGFNASAKDAGTHRFVRISDITNGEIAWDTVPFCECDDPETYLLEKHDIVVARTGGTTGKSYMFSTPPKGAIYAGYLIRVRANSETNPSFLSVFLNSYLYWSQITSLNRDEFRPSVNAEKLKELRLPKFDRAMQDQIALLSNNPTVVAASSIRAEINAVLAKRNAHESIVAEITYQQSLLAKLKQAILQEAIEGKLTSDWRASHPEVEPARELLQRIQAEKASLIAAKKLRPEKPLPKITPAEIPFEIPKGWEWCRLAKIMICRDGERDPISKAERERRGKGYPYYGASGVIDSIDGFTHDGDFLLVGEDGSNLRLRSTPVAFGAHGKIWVNNHAHVLQFIDPVLQEFVAHRLNGMDIAEFVTGGFQPKLSQENLNRIPIPLPPLAEQVVIVERVESLMATCRALESEIEQTRTHAAHLLQAVLKEAFAPAST